MKDVPASMTTAWHAKVKTGPRRPICRATIQRTQIQSYSYDTYNMPGGEVGKAVDQHAYGVYTSVLFGNPNPVREIKNIQSNEWDRSADQDVATNSLTLLNSEVTPIGSIDDETGDYDQPGYFTFSRGSDVLSQTRWGFKTNGWRNVFVPDSLVKTYEGYGIDESVDPERDPNLVQTGAWLIDKVTMDAKGSLVLESRDVGRLLLDQIAFPPVIPASEYPLAWVAIHNEQTPSRDSKGGKWRDLVGRAQATSSNQYYIGRKNGSHQMVDSRGGVRGHYPSMGLKNDKAYFDPYGQLKPQFKTYWLSHGAKVQGQLSWWQANFNDRTTALNAVRIHAFSMGPVYVSILGKDGWYGRKKIPYDATKGAYGINIHADIPFVAKARAEYARPFDITLPKVYKDVRAVRITFANQWYQWGGDDEEFPWYQGLYDLMIYTAKNGNDLHFGPGTITKTVGNYNDYSDIPLWVSAWCGWFQPEPSTGQNFMRTGVGNTDADKVWYAYPSGAVGSQQQEYRLARGHIFGRWDNTLTHGLADLTPDLFDKKPMMDMINYVRDLIGFLYLIDEDGAVVWREPNLFRLGNYKTIRTGAGTKASPYQRKRVETSEVVTIDEKQTLLSYSTVMSSENIKERIFVANVTGNFGTVISGYNPVPTGIRRVGGYTDQHFANKRETVVMADMIAARAMFEWRRGSVTTPGYPKLQIDDQVRILERVTSETYYHYILGIKSSNNVEEGSWEYELETHWLGEKPSDAWVIDSKELHQETQNFLKYVRQG